MDITGMDLKNEGEKSKHGSHLAQDRASEGNCEHGSKVTVQYVINI
jgi:hypothetical protein